MTEMRIQTAAGNTVKLDNCTDGIELEAIESFDAAGAAENIAYATLTDDEALQLAHTLIGMVMERRSA